MNLDFVRELNKICGVVRPGASLSDLTTFRLGGPALCLVEPADVEQLKSVLRWLNQENLPWFILGGGSNVLFQDEGFPGVVIRLSGEFNALTVKEDSGRRLLVRAGAAVPTAGLVKFCRREGLTGLEFMAGIPGWIGGALAMNAGAHGGEISQALVDLDIVTREGMLKTLKADEVRRGYRRLDLPAGSVVTGGLFDLARTDRETVEQSVREIVARRLARQPLHYRCAGSVFKNPPGYSAGRMIEEAGLKGLTMGGAWVAREHANFIVHKGDATAAEVIELIQAVQKEIKRRYGVDLETEIKIISRPPEGA